MYRRACIGGIGITIVGFAGCTSDNGEGGFENGDDSSNGDVSDDGAGDNSEGSQSRTEQVSIISVELLTEEVAIGEEVELEIGIENESEYSIEYAVTIEANGETIGQEELNLNHEAVTTIVFTWEPEEEGEYDLAANGVAGGTVSVQ